MKIGILTYYGVHNHGAVLQANALKDILVKKGHQVEFLSFSRNYDFITKENQKKYKIGLSSIGFYIKYAIKKGIGNISFNLRKNKILNKYRKANIPMGKRYSDFEGDLVIVGSDEVFAIDVGINPFFFGHGIKAKKIISYAGCFGETTIDCVNDNNFVNLISSGFQLMDKISVRDNNSKLIVEAISQKKAEIVCDPVILHGYKAQQMEFKPKHKNYMLIYSYDKNMNNKEEIEEIKKFAKSKKLKVYSIGYHHKWCDKNLNVSPEQLLGFIKNAKLVLTDTFHGSVLSLICNSQFAVKLRQNQNKLAYLLQEYELQDRIIESFNQLEIITEKQINFDKVNVLIEKNREKSMSFLQEALEIGNDTEK